MANPTTNYSFAMPTNTDLVKDLPADFDIFGQAVDDRIKALNPETTAGDISYRASTANAKSRLAIGTAGQVLTVNSGATAPEWQTPSSGGMTLISTTTLSGASITLSSIPQTYKDLQIIIQNYKPSVDGDPLAMRFNGDTTANRHRVNTVLSYGSIDFDANRIVVAGEADNSVADGLNRVQIPDYTNATTWKMAFIFGFVNLYTNATTYASSFTSTGVYNQTNAITSLEFYSLSGNMTSGSVLLYGVK